MGDKVIWLSANENVSNEELERVRDVFKESKLTGYYFICSDNRLKFMDKEDLKEVINDMRDLIDE